MTRKHTSAPDVETPIKVVLVTLDNHVNGAIARAEKRLTHDLPGIDFTSFAATEWEADPQSLSDCRAAIAQGDIVIVTMLFMEPHIKAISDALAARRDDCDAMVCCMSAPEVMQYTRMGGSQWTVNLWSHRITQTSPGHAERWQARRLRRAEACDVTEFASHTSFFSRDGAGRKCLLPHPSILARRIRG